MKIIDAHIGSGQSLSDVIDIHGAELVGIMMPDQWTTANITLQSSIDGQHWYNLHNMLGVEIFVAVNPNDHVIIDPPFSMSWDSAQSSFSGLSKIRLRSGTAASPVNQAQDANLILVLRDQ